MTAEIKGYLLTEEETEACLAIIMKMREEKAREEAIQKCKLTISSQIADSISKIGLAETKTIVRELARELRDFKADE